MYCGDPLFIISNIVGSFTDGALRELTEKEGITEVNRAVLLVKTFFENHKRKRNHLIQNNH